MGNYFRAVVHGSVMIVDVVQPVGSLAEYAILDEWEAVLQTAQPPEISAVIVDFQQTPYFGSSLLEALRILWKAIENRPARMFLCNLAPVGREIIQLAKFDQLWPVSETLQQALEMVHQSA